MSLAVRLWIAVGLTIMLAVFVPSHAAADPAVLTWQPGAGSSPAIGMLNPRHRYVILCRGVPVYTTNDAEALKAFLWGRDIKDQYVVFDYERPYPVDTADLLAWFERLAASRR